MSEMISKHFSKQELQCPCCGVAAVQAKLLIALEELRSLVGGPIYINSGYRCPARNKAEGGAQSSEHVQGAAADVACPKGMTLKSFYELIQKVPAFKNGGIGLYPAGRGQNTDFAHVDVRSKPARWSRIDGQYLAIEQAFKSNGKQKK